MDDHSDETWRRKERREGILLAVIGAAFLAAGVLIWVVGSPWMGAMSFAFGVMGLIMGPVIAIGKDTPAGRIGIIVGCFAFAATGALSIATSLLTPEAFGWRGPTAGIIAGVLCLGFFGPGTVLLIVKEIRRRRR
ncbi:MAG: hypothetical protein ACTHZX_09705 [Microbacterium sp.]